VHSWLTLYHIIK